MGGYAPNSRQQGGDVSHLLYHCLEVRVARADWEGINKRGMLWIYFLVNIFFLSYLSSLACPGLAPQDMHCRSDACREERSRAAALSAFEGAMP